MPPVVPFTPPDVTPEPEWIDFHPFPETGGPNVSFVSTGPTGGRLRVAYFKRTTDGALVGRAWFGPETEGPPGHAHGGSMAAVLDEVLGAAAWAEGHRVVVASLKVDFRQLLPLGTDATFESWIDHVEGRKVHTRGRLLGPDGLLFAEGKALCVMLGDHHIEKFKHHARKHPRPDEHDRHGAADWQGRERLED
jgi:acyl-coenzyme A thioesterase PaaI-like protein